MFYYKKETFVQLFCIGMLNMDETPVWLEMSCKATLDVNVKSTVHEQENITVTLSAHTDGSKMALYKINITQYVSKL